MGFEDAGSLGTGGGAVCGGPRLSGAALGVDTVDARGMGGAGLATGCTTDPEGFRKSSGDFACATAAAGLSSEAGLGAAGAGTEGGGGSGAGAAGGASGSTKLTGNHPTLPFSFPAAQPLASFSR